MDFSSFNDDTANTDNTQKDNAYTVKVGGGSDYIAYDLYYLYTGARYTSIGNLGLTKDKEGYGGDFGFQNDNHTLALAFEQLHDNVEDYAFLPTVTATSGSIQYSYTGLEQSQWSVYYEKTHTQSAKEPAGSDKIATDQDSAGLNIGISTDTWQHDITFELMLNKDREDNTQNEQTLTVSYAPTYTPGSVYLSSVTSTFTYINDTFDQKNRNSDTYSLNLDMAGDLIEEALTYSLQGTIEHQAFNGTPDTDHYNGSGRVEYFIPVRQVWMEKASCGLKADYDKTDSDQTQQTAAMERYSVSLFLNLPVSYLF